MYEFPRENILIRLYGKWCDRKGYLPMSADELVLEIDNHSDKVWLTRFIRVWEHYATGRGKF